MNAWWEEDELDDVMGCGPPPGLTGLTRGQLGYLASPVRVKASRGRVGIQDKARTLKAERGLQRQEPTATPREEGGHPEKAKWEGKHWDPALE